MKSTTKKFALVAQNTQDPIDRFVFTTCETEKEMQDVYKEKKNKNELQLGIGNQTYKIVRQVIYLEDYAKA